MKNNIPLKHKHARLIHMV